MEKERMIREKSKEREKASSDNQFWDENHKVMKNIDGN